jgi:hypothetical protein
MAAAKLWVDELPHSVYVTHQRYLYNLNIKDTVLYNINVPKAGLFTNSGIICGNKFFTNEEFNSHYCELNIQILV